MQVASSLCLVLYASVAYAQFRMSVVVPGFGVPLTVLVMALAGSLVGFAHMPPVEPRKKLYTMIIANTVIAAWTVVLLPEWRGWTVSEVAQPPLAGVLAVLSVVLVPLIIKRLPEAASGIIDRLLQKFFKPNSGGPA